MLIADRKDSQGKIPRGRSFRYVGPIRCVPRLNTSLHRCSACELRNRWWNIVNRSIFLEGVTTLLREREDCNLWKRQIQIIYLDRSLTQLAEQFATVCIEDAIIAVLNSVGSKLRLQVSLHWYTWNGGSLKLKKEYHWNETIFTDLIRVYFIFNIPTFRTLYSDLGHGVDYVGRPNYENCDIDQDRVIYVRNVGMLKIK